MKSHLEDSWNLLGYSLLGLLATFPSAEVLGEYNLIEWSWRLHISPLLLLFHILWPNLNQLILASEWGWTYFIMIVNLVPAVMLTCQSPS